MERPRSLGIIGRSPRGVRGPLRVASFREFQRLAGELAPAPYPAGHAACHALMNGVGRVLFVGVEGEDDATAVAETAERLLRSGEVGCLVVPGCEDVDALQALVATWEGAAPEEGCLWLDPPAGASAAEVEDWLGSLGASRPSVRAVVPRVPTLTPGTRAMEVLPGSCLVAPLHLGTARALRGVHDVPEAPGPDEVARLREAGCGLLAPRGSRRQVALAFPPPLPSARTDRPPEDPVAAAVREATQELALTAPNGPALWKSAERRARGALDSLRRRGVITGYHVRCDEETNEGSPEAPVLEVRVRYPRRVREVIIRVGRGASEATP